MRWTKAYISIAQLHINVAASTTTLRTGSPKGRATLWLLLRMRKVQIECESIRHGCRSWGMGACNANDQGMPVWVKGSSAHLEYLGKQTQSSKRKTDCVVRVLQSRGHCIPFRPTIPPLQVAPSSACSVASLSQSPGH